MEANKVLQELRVDIAKLVSVVKNEFMYLPESTLNWKANAQSWSILECLEHLNLYARYYNPEITRALKQVQHTQFVPALKLSWLGKKSIEAVSATKVKPAKTLKRMNPQNSSLTIQTIEEFLTHQEELLALLQQAQSVDLNRKQVRIEFFKLLKLSIGETLLFMAEHEKRHLQQALRVKNKATSVNVVSLVV